MVVADLDDELADTVMARFAEVNFSRVTNLSGFLMGIVRRVQQDGPGHGARNMDDLQPSIRRRLLDLVDAVRTLFHFTSYVTSFPVPQGRLHYSDIDPRMTRSLQSLPSNLAMEVLDKFSYADLDNVRSKTGFMLGIVKRLQVRTRDEPQHH